MLNLRVILGSNLVNNLELYKNKPITKKSRYRYVLNISHLLNENGCHTLHSFLKRCVENISILLSCNVFENKSSFT